MVEEIGGYVLAGGRSSRMGQDKALVSLAGQTLVDRAVEKLRRVCADVRLLSGREDLRKYAALVPDAHQGCGPMGGMEAGLAHSTFEWNLFLAVDMPFLPTAFVRWWVRLWLRENAQDRGARVGLFEVEGRPQPGFCLLHRDVRPYLTAALNSGDYKLLPVLQRAGQEIAEREGFPAVNGLWLNTITELLAIHCGGATESCMGVSQLQITASHLWFANVNTPEELSLAQRYVKTLDTWEREDIK